jgi:hypothetical protein
MCKLPYFAQEQSLAAALAQLLKDVILNFGCVWCCCCRRFKVIDMLQDYEMGPFTVTPLRVTHSIPDCCGLIMRR